MKKELEHLTGTTVGDWELVKFVDEGNSAAVFLGRNGAQQAAVKVFKPSLVDEFGKDRQLDRINRELTLRGHDHPNLIQIFDGGSCVATGYLFLVMEFIDGPDLAEVISDVPRDRIRSIIAQVADAARYLEARDIVHRDIKPDNIAISRDFSKATLLDLGVIRPLDVSKLTASSEGERQNFLGTLRYSPPEYIFRKEKRDCDGYRSITFYQLGAVLYDMISKERLFEAFSLPKPRLMKAVEQEVPKINQPDVSQDLILLADNCLLKDPERRLEFVNWDDFQEQPEMEPSFAARERVRRRFGSSLQYVASEQVTATDRDISNLLGDVQNFIVTSLKDTCSGEREFPRSTTLELEQCESTAEVQLIFETKTALSIVAQLSLLVTTTVLDTSPIVVSIDFRAITSYEESQDGLGRLRESKANNLFKGVLNKSIIAARLEAAIFEAIDFAQSVGDKPQEIELTIKSESVNGSNLVARRRRPR